MRAEPTDNTSTTAAQPPDRPTPRSWASMKTTERPARPGEACTCGRPAVTVFITERGETGYCGIADGGARRGPRGS